ncbi:hypothetical protein J6590_040907 [Homalodisca vitripennis]|nr:hypothetical protein J6590_040907 [Homalodisca vitripennis]
MTNATPQHTTSAHTVHLTLAGRCTTRRGCGDTQAINTFTRETTLLQKEKADNGLISYINGFLKQLLL